MSSLMMKKPDITRREKKSINKQKRLSIFSERKTRPKSFRLKKQLTLQNVKISHKDVILLLISD